MLHFGTQLMVLSILQAAFYTKVLCVTSLYLRFVFVFFCKRKLVKKLLAEVDYKCTKMENICTYK